MKVSVSLLGLKDINKKLPELNFSSVDFFHIDIMDGKFVENKIDQFKELEYLAGTYAKPLDVHLMVEDPTPYIKRYSRLNTEYLTIHLELEKDLLGLIDLIKSFSMKPGLAINPTTPISLLEPYLPYIDLVLLMSVVPGKGGQTFIPSSVRRLEELKALRKEFDFVIAVDGGINKDIRKLIDLNERDIIVSGSYLLSGNLEDNIRSLR